MVHMPDGTLASIGFVCSEPCFFGVVKDLSPSSPCLFVADELSISFDLYALSSALSISLS